MRSPRITGHSRKSAYTIKNGSTKPTPTNSFRQRGVPFVRGRRWTCTPGRATRSCIDILAPLIDNYVTLSPIQPSLASYWRGCVALGLVATKYIGERHHIEVQFLGLEGCYFPLSIPVESGLPAAEQSNGSSRVGGGKGNLALKCKVGHK